MTIFWQFFAILILVGLFLAEACGLAARPLDIEILDVIADKDLLEAWESEPVNLKQAKLTHEQFLIAKTLLLRGLARYPDEVIQRTIRRVYLLKELICYVHSASGSYTPDALILVFDGEESFNRQIDHELSSLMIKEYEDVFPWREWEEENPRDFSYLGSTLLAVKKNLLHMDIDDDFCKEGFLTEYSTVTLENDINLIAENSANPTQRFANAVKLYPKIANKVRLYKAFLEKIDPKLAETLGYACSSSPGVPIQTSHTGSND